MKQLAPFVAALALSGALVAQATPGESGPTFEAASASIDDRLEDAVEELGDVRRRMAEEKLELNRTLNELESELSEVREEYQRTSRLLDRSTLDLSNLRGEIRSRKDETDYLSNLFNEYIRNFEARVHIAELQRYGEPLEEARLAPERSDATPLEVYEAQTALLDVSLDRLEEALGGTRFAGTAVDASGRVEEGTFLLLGPAALFLADGADVAGTAEQRLGSLEPAEVAYANPEHGTAAANLVGTGKGTFPLDPTLGNAHKFEATNETWLEHVQKGGTVMIPIFVMAGTALLVALFKWLRLAFIRKPSRKRLEALLDAVERRDEGAVREAVSRVPGPTGKMLSAGVAHLGQPRELIEEVMYEIMLTTRLKLQRMLPFIAICAASAPLLGLLGTVTGIISTFKLITVFGSGDVKTLSGGISEALITTEYGLIVAIPSLLLHAFLSRKARAIVSHMETSAVAFVNQVSRVYGTPDDRAPRDWTAEPEPERSTNGSELASLVAALRTPAPSPTPAAQDGDLARHLAELQKQMAGLTHLGERVEELGRQQEKVAALMSAGAAESEAIRSEPRDRGEGEG